MTGNANMKTRKDKIDFLNGLLRGERQVQELSRGSIYTIKQMAGSPDSIVLKNWTNKQENFIGIDELKRIRFYPEDILAIPEDLLCHQLNEILPGKLTKVIIGIDIVKV